jgi:hypothetical protein
MNLLSAIFFCQFLSLRFFKERPKLDIKRTSIKVRMMRAVRLEAYLEEELYDALTYIIQNPNGADFESKKKCIEDIGREFCMMMAVLMQWRICFIQLI